MKLPLYNPEGLLSGKLGLFATLGGKLPPPPASIPAGNLMTKLYKRIHLLDKPTILSPVGLEQKFLSVRFQRFVFTFLKETNISNLKG